MTALEIAMAGYLAFGQPTGDYYEAITKHSGLQVIHADGAVTLRLKESEERREESGVDDSMTVVVRLNDERYPFEARAKRVCPPPLTSDRTTHVAWCVRV